ncbi:hypothetical protein CC79DRAFT_1395630 [Sarocladium strictum]
MSDPLARPLPSNNDGSPGEHQYFNIPHDSFPTQVVYLSVSPSSPESGGQLTSSGDAAGSTPSSMQPPMTLNSSCSSSPRSPRPQMTTPRPHTAFAGPLSQLTPPPQAFGVDPPRPPRDGYE